MTSNTLELIRSVEEADSSEKLLDAVKALAEACHCDAIDTLIAALGYNNPGAAVAAVDGLIALGEVAVEPLLKQLDGYNYGARAWAIRALAGIGDPRGLEILLNAAETDFALSVRRAAARGLGGILWHKMDGELVPINQKRVLKTLVFVTEDPEWVVRYASVVALQSLGNDLLNYQPELIPEITVKLDEIARTDTELAVKARAVMGLNQA
ncbi:MAG: HEAT repeat domain-containing protein [Nostocaceae cyanobacterium]|nr:HEAT repeat domain-containing protein [Nostocaceae cyanobacterium]